MAAYICHKERDRQDDLKYLATVLDNYPWNEKGWWASTIDVKTGEPKEDLSKPSIINKNASLAMAAAMLSEYLNYVDPALSVKLKQKADTCIYKQIIPAQESDGYWHYALNGNDPNNKDILGYFLVTLHALIQTQQFTTSYRDPAFQHSLDKACAFALQAIAPMTDPNTGHPPPANRTTPATPVHYKLSRDPKRGFAVGLALLDGKHFAEGEKIIDHWLQVFPYGSSGMDAAHAIHPTVLMLLILQ
jgi:hypothetical protein